MYATICLNCMKCNIVFQNGFTALHYAAERKWECCVQFLVGNGASPNSKTSVSTNERLNYQLCFKKLVIEKRSQYNATNV